MRYLFQRFFPQAVVFYAFLIFFVVGTAVHRDYGVSADEAAVRKFGSNAFNYLFGSGAIPTELDWSFFNPAIPMLLHGIEQLPGLTDGADIWFMRHMMTFCMFFVTVIAFYLIAKLRFHDWKLSLLGSVMFILSPRLFAHGFHNPKDIPAMMLFTLSALTLLLFLEKPRPRMAASGILLLHIICTAMLISMRVFGLMMPLLAMMFLISRPGTGALKTLQWIVIYVVALCLGLILIWPLLWHDPIRGIISAFLNTTSRSGGGFYFGESFSSAGVPWHYLPVWIGITTPVIYSIFFLIGFVTLWIRCIRIAPILGRAFCLLREKRATGLALLWFSLPVIALMILPIGIFDEWRHMLFLYPAFLLIALEGVMWVGMITKKKWIAPALIGLQIASTGTWMIRNHPFEYAYFSIPSRFIDGQFELDYWGLSYRGGLEWIVKNDTRDHINVFTAARVGKTAADTLPIADWSRLYFTTPDKANYILDNFRAHEYRQIFPEDRKVHAVTVDGLEILAVYKGPDTQKIFEPVIW